MYLPYLFNVGRAQWGWIISFQHKRGGKRDFISLWETSQADTGTEGFVGNGLPDQDHRVSVTFSLSPSPYPPDW